MARVGIYIGDKEIIRRYVGDKIVWRKSYYTQVYSGRYIVLINDRNGLEKEFKIYGDGFKQLVGNMGEGKIELNDNTALFKSLKCEFINGRYDDAEHYSAIITFLNQQDKDLFVKSDYHHTNIKIFKKVYK